MPTLKGIKRKIRSVRGTMKITGAMKLISASRLRKAQLRVGNIELYEKKLKEITLQVAEKDGEITHPAFLLRKDAAKTLLIAITAERGFCGGLCDQMTKQIASFIGMMKGRGTSTEVWVAGAKGARCFRRDNVEALRISIPIDGNPFTKKIDNLAKGLLKAFLNGRYDQVIIAYSNFISAASHPLTLEMFLPVWVRDEERPKSTDKVDFLYEPSKDAVLAALLKKTLSGMFNRALAEAHATELAARLIAMTQSQKNAENVVARLTREYNTSRQAAITRELIDIVGGAEALRTRD